MKILSSLRTGILPFLFIPFFFSCKQEEKPVTVTESKEFGKQLQSSIEKRNPDFMDAAIDKKVFLKKTGLSVKSFGSGIEKGMKMGTAIIRAISQKGTYQLVKQYEKNTSHHLLFRLYDKGSLNYHDIELTRAGGKIKIADIFVYTTGEFLSETIKGLFNQMKDYTKSSAQDSWIKKLPEMRRLMNEGKHGAALDIYKELPPDIQKGRAVQIIHVLISSGLDDAQYTGAIEQYQKLYPDEPNMHLLLLDGFILKKEYDKALNGINEMDKMINKDPFLDYYRYLCYNLKEDHVNAKISLERLMKNMPDFEDGMIELIAVYLEEKNETASKKWIDEYKLHSSFDQDKLNLLLETN